MCEEGGEGGGGSVLERRELEIEESLRGRIGSEDQEWEGIEREIRVGDVEWAKERER